MEQPPVPIGPTLTGNPNTLDQGRLFTCVPEETEYTRGRYWRLSGAQFMRGAQQIAATSQGLINPFSGSQSGRRFVNVADAYSVVEPELDMILIAGRAAAKRGLGDNKMPGCIRSAYQPIVKQGEPEPDDPLAAVDEGCRRSMASWGLARVLRRAPTEEEVTDFAERFAQLFADLGVEQGAIASFTLLLAHPEFLFRREVGEPVPGEGRNLLTHNELASALSFTINNDTPRNTMLTGEGEGDAEATRALIREEVRRLFGERGYEDVMLDFLSQYTHYADTSNVFKNGTGQEASHTGKAVLRSRNFMRFLIEQDTDFLANLLTSTRMYDETHRFEDATFSEDPTRPGILTRVSWLFTMSQTDHNDPIKRGHWIRENLMCQSIPEIPIDVIPQLPPKRDDQTLRDRLGQHVADASCKGCHDLMDPLGLPFERWDDWGEWRDEEAGAPVDTSGEVMRFTDVTDGPVADAHELVHRLAGSSEVERCFVRHVFRYTMGRDETYGDACTLERAHDDYVASGGSLEALLESLATSDTFIYRAQSEEQP